MFVEHYSEVLYMIIPLHLYWNIILCHVVFTGFIYLSSIWHYVAFVNIWLEHVPQYFTKLCIHQLAFINAQLQLQQLMFTAIMDNNENFTDYCRQLQFIQTKISTVNVTYDNVVHRVSELVNAAIVRNNRAIMYTYKFTAGQVHRG